VTKAATGLLHVVVRPWGQVIVDGKVLGTTPFPAVQMPSGRHTVRVSHPAYEVLERAVTVENGKIAKIVIDLPKEGVRK
jgi:hypothetical protein